MPFGDRERPSEPAYLLTSSPAESRTLQIPESVVSGPCPPARLPVPVKVGCFVVCWGSWRTRAQVVIIRRMRYQVIARTFTMCGRIRQASRGFRARLWLSLRAAGTTC